MKQLAQRYFRSLYQRAMTDAYEHAYRRIAGAPGNPLRVLECGAGTGGLRARLAARIGDRDLAYTGLDWNPAVVERASANGVDLRRADLNHSIPATDGAFDCVCALSVLEHLLNPCRFLLEAHRVLRPGGRLVLLTPNISTYFTALLVLFGRMPSSGPHPDSSALLRSEELLRVTSVQQTAVEQDFPEHRHLVVFSFLVLRRYLHMIGFVEVQGRGFGLYPFPNTVQPLLQRLDPYHCHQMVFTATRSASTGTTG